MKMKILCMFFCLFAGAVSAMAQEDPAKNKKGAVAVQDTNNYVFYAETAFPLTEGARLLNGGYELRFSPKKLSCYLPYFGTPETMNYGMNDTDVELSTTEFSYTSEKSKKEGEMAYIVLRPKKTSVVNKILITTYDNGNAFVRLSFNNRQNISYRGKLMVAKPTAEKEGK